MFQPKIIGQNKSIQEEQENAVLNKLISTFTLEKIVDNDYCKRKLTFLYSKSEEEIISFLEQFNKDVLVLERELALFFENKESMLDKNNLLEQLGAFGKETFFDKLKNKILPKETPNKEFYEELISKIQFLMKKLEKLLLSYGKFNKELSLFLDISLFFYKNRASKVNATNKFWELIDDKNKFYFLLLNQTLATENQLKNLQASFKENIKQSETIIFVLLPQAQQKKGIKYVRVYY